MGVTTRSMDTGQAVAAFKVTSLMSLRSLSRPDHGNGTKPVINPGYVPADTDVSDTA